MRNGAWCWIAAALLAAGAQGSAAYAQTAAGVAAAPTETPAAATAPLPPQSTAAARRHDANDDGRAAERAGEARSVLERYLSGLVTLRADFVQALADARGQEIDRASGTLIVQRPGKFSWEIHPQKGEASGGQLMVCDGRNLWFYDRDLAQVTVKPVDAALSATPVMLLSGAPQVQRSFKVSSAGERLGLTWVMVEPRTAAADFRQALLGFARGELKRMILEDKLGQTATVMFSRAERNTAVKAAEVSFTAPAGVDVIGTPRP